MIVQLISNVKELLFKTTKTTTEKKRKLNIIEEEEEENLINLFEASKNRG